MTLKKLIYLHTVGPDTPTIVEKLRGAGYEVMPARSVEQAERLLETGNGDALLFEWPFGDRMRWIKRRWITICQNPMVTFDEFLVDLNKLFENK